MDDFPKINDIDKYIQNRWEDVVFAHNKYVEAYKFYNDENQTNEFISTCDIIMTSFLNDLSKLKKLDLDWFQKCFSLHRKTFYIDTPTYSRYL